MSVKANIKTVEDCFDNSIRVEKIIHLASMCFDYSYPSDVEEALEFDYEEILKSTGIEVPEDSAEREEWISALLRDDKLGFLVQVATPVPYSFDEDGGYSHGGWGHYTTRWFYVDEFYDVFEETIKWQKEFLAERQKDEVGK